MAVRRRLDEELVRRGLAPSRSRGRALIDQRAVTVAGAPATKAGRLVHPAEPVEVREPARFVSRGGDKLDAGLDVFSVTVAGRRALDVGASTGGFTDCLLQRGARQVVALDVGRAQLHERLRADRRVVVVEGCNIRDLGPDRVDDRVRRERLGEPFDIVVVDVSFIGLGLVLPAVGAVARADADVVVLVKPQFEAGRSEVSRGGGVVTDPAVWSRVLDRVATDARAAGLPVQSLTASPLRGAAGNAEFLAHLRPSAVRLPEAAWRAERDAAIELARGISQ